MIPVERIDESEAPVPQMPRNIEAEAALLGALLIDNRMADALDERLAPGHFYEPGHGRVFGLIKDMRAAEKLANPVTLRPLVEQDRDITRLGGAQYLAELTAAGGAGLIGARQFALQIYELAVLRSLADVGRALVDSALDTGEEVNASAKIEHAEQLLAGIASNNDGGGRSISFRDAIAAAVRRSEAIGAGRETLGVQIADLPEWNDIVTGMQPGEMILLGGRPSTGKTALSLAVARGAAKAGHGTLFISREMKVEPIAMRMLADLLFEAGSQATFDDVRRGNLSRDDYVIAAGIEERIASWPLEFEEPDRLNAARIAPMIRKHKRRMERRGQSLDLVIIDYVGLLDPVTARSSREQEISDISRAIKAAANATGVAIIALCQLNRGVEQREDKRPQLSDLRDSGSLEQDADAVIFVYRHQYYLERAEPPMGSPKRPEWEAEMEIARNRLEIRAGKVRQGSIQNRECLFFGQHQAVRSDAGRWSGGGYPL